MSNLFWLTEAQIARLDDRRVLSGLIFINRNGLRWCDAAKEYGSVKTLYNRWKWWGDKGVFARMMHGLASGAAIPKTVMIAVNGMRHWSEHAPASNSRRTARLRACGRKRGA